MVDQGGAVVVAARGGGRLIGPAGQISRVRRAPRPDGEQGAQEVPDDVGVSVRGGVVQQRVAGAGAVGGVGVDCA